MQDEKRIEDMSFEEAMNALEKLVGDLDAGNVPLEQSVVLYERGAALKAHCQKKLDDAELKICEITKAGQAKEIEIE